MRRPRAPLEQTESAARIAAGTIKEDLQRHVPLKAGIARAIHFTHTARSKRTDDSYGPNLDAAARVTLDRLSCASENRGQRRAFAAKGQGHPRRSCNTLVRTVIAATPASRLSRSRRRPVASAR